MSDGIQPPASGTVGEEALIQRYFAPLAVGAPGALGLRDDAASLTPTPGHDLVVTTDAIAEGVHFLPNDPPVDIGWKALAVNLSDLAAKGATPRVYVMALAMPELPPPSWLEQFAAGLREAQSAHGCHLIGGDTDRRPGPLSVTITAFGEAPEGRMVQRRSARPGDALYVTGTLGDAALGLRLRLADTRSGRWRLSEEQSRYLQQRYLRPLPRTALAPALLAQASAAMDLSDGLAKDLGRMARASGIAAEVAFAALPLSNAARAVLAADDQAAELIVSGGDDYELLIAVPPDRTQRFEAAAADCGVMVTRVGRCVTGAGVEISAAGGRPMRLARPGWDHF